jgi:glutaredoxin
MPDSEEGKQAQRFFNRKGVAYDDLDVSADPQALKKMQELSGQTDRPVIVVDKQVYVGFQQVELESAVPSLF